MAKSLRETIDQIKNDLPPRVLVGRTVLVKVGEPLPQGIFCGGWRVDEGLYLIVGEEPEEEP